MSDTHPNAFRAEANELRKQGSQLIDAAKALEAQADELEKSAAPAVTETVAEAPVAPAEEAPATADSKKK